MRSRLFTHRCTHWMAIVVIWFAALAPTLSHALQHGTDLTLDDICTAAGFVGASADGRAAPADQPAPGHATGHFEHCPFCFLQGHAVALPSPSLSVEPPAGLRDEVPHLFLQVARTPHVWAVAQARAPPLSA